MENKKPYPMLQHEVWHSSHQPIQGRLLPLRLPGVCNDTSGRENVDIGDGRSIASELVGAGLNLSDTDAVWLIYVLERTKNEEKQ